MMIRILAKRRLAAALAALLVLLAVAACGSSQESAVDENEPSEETAEAVLEAYRNYGGEVLALSVDNPVLTAEVKDLQGTVPAYDLTGGNPPCSGFVRALPSLIFTLDESAGSFKAAFTGNGLSSLIVVAEGEDIVCDPSAPPVLKPELEIKEPVAGRYGVWVGRADTQFPLDGMITVSLEQ